MKMFVFTNPENTHAVLRHDKGWSATAVADTHPTGRAGQSFTIPTDTPNGWGAELYLTADKRNPIRLRGILTFSQDDLAYLLVDDFQLFPEKECPPVNPPQPEPPPVQVKTPKEAIDIIYATGLYDLQTKEGCGKFTEEVCNQLHSMFSKQYGHVRKTGAQNQYNGHAVDAINLLQDHNNFDGTTTKAGVYDIIFSTESPEAKPSFNRVGNPAPELWYFPA